MTEEHLSEMQQNIETRKELFRYTDLNHPAMQALFDLQLDVTMPSKLEQD